MDASSGVDFLISYVGVDEAWATWIAEVLESEGQSVAVQAWDSVAGDNVVAWISKQMAAARRTVAVCSQAYFASHWRTQEWSGALAGRKLIPVRVEDCRLPPVMSTIDCQDLHGVDEASARQRVMEAAGLTKPERRSAGFPGTAVFELTPVRAAFPGRLPPIWGPVPARNMFFTGRDRLLRQLHGRLAHGGRVAVCALQGFGGVGKTQLAIEYAWHHAGDYELVWWVDAETPTGLAAGLADLAGELGVAAVDAPARVLQGLAELGRRQGWLLIYDNVPDPTSIARFLPPSTGHLIITCRDPTISRVGAGLVEVGEFTRPESMDLLRRYVPDLGDDDAVQLADGLGDLPLAVDQAGAFLAETGIAVNDYLELLAAQPQVLLDGQSLHHPGLAATVTTAYTHLAAEHPHAAALLDSLAFLAPEPIPMTAAPPGGAAPRPGRLVVGEALTAHTAIGAISRYALARRSGTTLQIHRLVHALLRARLTPDQQRHALVAALDLLAAAPCGDPHDSADWPSYAALVPHINAAAGYLPAYNEISEAPDFRALLVATCWYLLGAGQYSTAHDLAHAARSRWITALGPDHPDCGAATSVLAANLADLGDPQAARELGEEVLTRHRRILGEDHPETLRSAANLIHWLNMVGSYGEAEQLGEDTMIRSRRVLGPEHPDSLGAAHNLAVALTGLEELEAALMLDESTLASRRRVLGPDHPHTLRSGHTLSITLARLGDHQAARELAEDTLVRRRLVLGENHPDTLSAARNLAVQLAALGEHQAAQALARDALARERQLPDPMHSRIGPTPGDA